MGGADEHLQGTGRGDSDGGAYSQLSFFLSENEDVYKRQEENSIEKKLHTPVREEWEAEDYEFSDC